MKLKNKKTGEIGYTAVLRSKAIVVMDENAIQLGSYTSLAELNEEWEDAPEEPDKYWFINVEGEVTSIMKKCDTPEGIKACKAIGNYFATKEEADKAVKKLKAWERLKDKGFRIKDFVKLNDCAIAIRATSDESWSEIYDELNICFGGEE